MKKLLILLGVITAVQFAALVPTFAHVLKTDGNIGAILHVKPDDNPQSGVPTKYELSFNDTQDQFTVTDCDCTASWKSGGDIVATQKLTAKSERVGSGTVTFPKAGAYELTVIGKSANDQFTLTYNVRVGGEGAVKRESSEIPTLLLLGMAGVVGLILLGATRMRDDV